MWIFKPRRRREPGRGEKIGSSFRFLGLEMVWSLFRGVFVPDLETPIRSPDGFSGERRVKRLGVVQPVSGASPIRPS
jgi:hypothetical protein